MTMTLEFEKKTVDLPSGPLGYFTGGGGEGLPVLFLHSGGGLMKTRGLEKLAENHKLFMPIVPGFDGTDYVDGVDDMAKLAQMMAEFVDAELGGTCDLMGHSFGGWLALWLTLDHPHMVELLVLEAVAGLRPEAAGGMPDDAKELFRMLYAYPDKLTPDDRPKDVVRANQGRGRHYHNAIPFDGAVAARLPEIACPALILHGTLEEIIPEGTVHVLKQGIPNAYVMYVYDAAHFMQVDQPERFAGLVHDFFLRGGAFIVNQDVAAE